MKNKYQKILDAWTNVILTEEKQCPEGQQWCPIQNKCIVPPGRGRTNEENEDVKLKILNFFKNNPAPDDDKIHSMSDELDIDTHKFEAMVYAILGSFIGAGRAKEKSIEEKDVDAKELKMGIKVEMEHTTDPILAKRISLDHLSEIPDYYTRLIKMEKEAGIKD